jgi:hypothetical protein
LDKSRVSEGLEPSYSEGIGAERQPENLQMMGDENECGRASRSLHAIKIFRYFFAIAFKKTAVRGVIVGQSVS